jgi:hypothetical protein
MKRSVLVAVAVAAVHFVLQCAAFTIGFDAGMARFDQGGPASLVERAARLILAVASFPLASLAMHGGGGLRVAAQWFVVLANSLLWGMAAAGAAWGLGHAQRRVPWL